VAIASVTGLQTALDGKAASSHNHDASAINAGTLGADRLPLASANTRGAVRIGNGVSIDGNGVISVSGGGGSSYDQSLNKTDSPTFAGLTLGDGGSIVADIGDSLIGLQIDPFAIDPFLQISAYSDQTILDTLVVGVRASDESAFIQSSANRLRVEQSGGGLGDLTLAGIKFADDSQQTTAWTGGVDAANVTGLATVATSNSYDDLDDQPSLFDGDYTSLTNVPSTFAPVTASSSVIGGVRVGTGLSIDGDGILSASAVAYAVRSDTVSGVSYIGRALSGSATSASVWTIRRTTVAAAGTVTTATATSVKWDDRLTASYS
jgi:hypothetical protein